MPVPSLYQLPVEILFRILRYLDIQDILRIRKISRYLNQVSHRRDVWTNAYRNANVVRPPGPFLSQSVHDLENALISSSRVHRNLEHNGGTARTSREIRYQGVELKARLVFGRFLFIALKDEICCYDLNLDSNSGVTVIYKPTGGTTLKSFHCVSAIDVEGRLFACVVLSEEVQEGKQTRISIYLLIVAERSSEVTLTLDLLHQFEHDQFKYISVQLGPRVIVVLGNVGVGPDNHIDWRVVALEVHSRRVFLLPPFVWEANEISEWSAMAPLRSISTSTHIILARSASFRTGGWCTLFQAFPISNTHHASTHLSQSHRGIIHDIATWNVVLLHDAIHDPPTQDILIIMRVHAFEPSRPNTPLSKYGILYLDGKSPDGAGAITFQLLGSLDLHSFHPSFNGTGRAFYTDKPGSYGILSVLEYDLYRNGGSGDEPEGKVTEYCTAMRFPPLNILLDYDPYSGRICIRSCMNGYRAIEILDLAV